MMETSTDLKSVEIGTDLSERQEKFCDVNGRWKIDWWLCARSDKTSLGCRSCLRHRTYGKKICYAGPAAKKIIEKNRRIDQF